MPIPSRQILYFGTPSVVVRCCRKTAFGFSLLAFLVFGFPSFAGENVRYRPDRVLLVPKAGVGENNILALHVRRGHRVLRSYRGLGNLQVIQLVPGEAVGEAIQRYRASGLVEIAEPDYKLKASISPNDPEFLNGAQWHLHNTGLNGGLVNADIQASYGWDTIHDASNIVVAVIDSGIRYTHQDLAANIWTNPGEIPDNGIDDDHNGIVDDIHGLNSITDSADPMDDNGHGTHVAGIIGAVGNNGFGTVGVAWKVRLMACKFLDSAGNGDTSDAIQCIDYARRMGAKIINASWGGNEYSAALRSAISAAGAEGIIFVTAAGNDAQNLDVVPTYPAAYNLDNIITVCGTTRYDTFDASYSNYSPTKAHVGAPGTMVYSTWDSSDSSYSYESGTSMASPCVAGICALLKARYPAENKRQTIDRVLNNVDPLPSLSGKCSSGGRVNLEKALGLNPEAAFVPSQISGEPPLTLTFTNVSFGEITNTVWDFGDGTAKESALSPTHIFQFPGSFKVKLTVVGTTGRTNTSEKEIVVAPNYDVTTNAFAWIDPSQMTVLDMESNGVAEQTLPFAFNFYAEVQSSTLYVGANGVLGFKSAGMTNIAIAQLPSSGTPNALIAPYWENLNPDAGGAIYFGTVGTAPHRRAVATWVDVPLASGSIGLPLTFQAILEEDSGNIIFQYLETHPENTTEGGGRKASVGIENGSGTIGVSYTYNGAPNILSNGTAIKFSPKLYPYLVAFDDDPLEFSSTIGLSSSTTESLTLYNPGNTSVSWNFSSTASWVNTSTNHGTLAPGEIASIVLSLGPSAQTFGPGEYSGTVNIENLTDGAGGASFPITLLVRNVLPPHLEVGAPAINFDGTKGGPFSPSGFVIGVTNKGDLPLDWQGIVTTPWLTLSPTNSTLSGGQGTNLVLTVNSAAVDLTEGSFHGLINFENLMNGQGSAMVEVTLTVRAPTPVATISNGQFTGILTVPTDGSYMIEFSDDLQNWIELNWVESQEGKISISDPVADVQARFYRVRQL